MPDKKAHNDKATPERNRLRKTDKLIVIGASTGGVPALKILINSLPAGFSTPIIIVWHMPADITGILPEVLNKCSLIPAANGINNELIQRNRIYIAPPDHHILAEGDRIRITKGPKENHFRPAIDPLFRSAAFEFGSRAIGVILSGGLDDGTSGLWAIKEFGGKAIIQDPAEAEVSSMPEHAVNAVETAHVVSIHKMGALLYELSKATIENKKIMPENSNLIKNEINAAMQLSPTPASNTFGEATQYACPECHGVLSAISENNIVRFRCHTGHAYSAESLLKDMSQKTEETLWNALRGFGETVLLLNKEGDNLSALNKPKDAAIFFQKAIAAQEHAAMITDILKKMGGDAAEK